MNCIIQSLLVKDFRLVQPSLQSNFRTLLSSPKDPSDLFAVNPLSHRQSQTITNFFFFSTYLPFQDIPENGIIFYRLLCLSLSIMFLRFSHVRGHSCSFFLSFFFLFSFFVFLPFLGLLPRPMEVPRLRVELEL